MPKVVKAAVKRCQSHACMIMLVLKLGIKGVKPYSGKDAQVRQNVVKVVKVKMVIFIFGFGHLFTI